jgi:gamma-glutamyltranspeptidase/glutathione hydrolase
MITSRPEIVGTFGVVTTTHWLATAVGMSILERGGNAFDAATAAGFVLQIVEPEQNGPGGDMPAIVWSQENRRVDVICGQGSAPSAATVERVRALGTDIMPGIGHVPAVVPGAFGAWMLLLRDYGTMELKDVLEPAISIARRGFAAKPELVDLLDRVAPFFKQHWPTSAAVFLSPAPHELMKLPAQADTYARIVVEAESAGGTREHKIEKARRAWYEGFVAEAIDCFFRQPAMDTTGEAHVGFLTGQDLATWRPAIEEPLFLDYGRYRVFKTGPWAQSPVFLQQLALLKGYDLEAMDPVGPEFVHTVQECAKLAFADRDSFYGDPKFVQVPVDILLSEKYNEERRVLISAHASDKVRPGRVGKKGGVIPAIERGSTQTTYREAMWDVGLTPAKTFAEFAASRHGDTCHIDVIDQWGNMISATPSGGWLSGAPVVPGLGFGISVRGQMFSLDSGHPNAIAPGKRPRTTLTPSMAFRNGEPYLAFGTPGGDQQDQWSLHAFLRHVHHNMNLQEAIDSPSFYTNHLNSSFFPYERASGHLSVECNFPRSTLAELDRRGHLLEIVGRWEQFNSVTMASCDGRTRKAAASPRRMQSYAIGR